MLHIVPSIPQTLDVPPIRIITIAPILQSSEAPSSCNLAFPLAQPGIPDADRFCLQAWPHHVARLAPLVPHDALSCSPRHCFVFNLTQSRGHHDEHPSLPQATLRPWCCPSPYYALCAPKTAALPPLLTVTLELTAGALAMPETLTSFCSTTASPSRM